MKKALLFSSSLLLLGSVVADDRFSVEVDYLLFQAHQDGLFRASDVHLLPQTGNTTTATQSTDKYIEDNRWNSGVRGSVTWEPECRSWNITAQYTYLGRTIPSKRLEGAFSGVTDPNNHFIFTDYVTNTITGSAASYSNQASWKFSFNQIDLFIEQPFCIGEQSCLTPYFGLRGLSINQHVKMSGHNVVPAGSGIPVFLEASIEPKFSGIGLVGGLEGRFALGCGFDLWGKFGGGLVWGRFQSNQSLNVEVPDGSAVVGIESNKLAFWGTSWNANFGLGVEWSCSFNCDTQWLLLTFGWENHLYTKTNNAQNFFLEQFAITPNTPVTFDRNVQRGDFCLQGFSLGVAYFL